jgi:hypothetical protein
MGLLDWLFGKTSFPKQNVVSKTADSKFTAIGNTEPICPYCNYRFDRMPQKKRKCPNCNNFVRSRTRPLDNKKVLIKEEELGELEKQWMGNERTQSFHLENTKAVAVGKIWRERLAREGGSDVSEIGPDGIVHRSFKPWLANAAREERERIGDIIISSIVMGLSYDETARKLEAVPSMQKYDVFDIAMKEKRFIVDSGNINRYFEEGIKKGEWVCIDPLEERHKKMNGKRFDLNDPIWAELYIEGCSCSIRPVIPGMGRGKK